MRAIRAVVALLMLALVVSGCSGLVSQERPSSPIVQDNGDTTGPDNEASPDADKDTPGSDSDSSHASESPTQPRTTEAVWVAAGDVMLHMPQYPGAYDKASKRYVFDPFFEQVAPILSSGDWSIVNLEVPLGGKELEYTGYPMFNAPPEMAEALKNSGVTIVGTANNHSLDRKETGVVRTLEALETQGLVFKGTARSQAEADQAVIVEKNEIKMGFLAYTYGTNGVRIPADKPYLVSLIDEDQMVEDIKQLKSAGADFITVALHFGIEYQFTPSEEQQRLAHKLIEAGADIIAGSHPHVVQPYELVDAVYEDGTPRQGVILYSMGNFISNQRGDFKDFGVIFRIHVTKHHDSGHIELSQVEPIPTWVHKYKENGSYQYRILPLEQTLSERSQPGLSSQDYKQLESSWKVLDTRLGSMLN